MSYSGINGIIGVSWAGQRGSCDFCQCFACYRGGTSKSSSSASTKGTRWYVTFEIPRIWYRVTECEEHVLTPTCNASVSIEDLPPWQQGHRFDK